jgi:hypothetical protein
MTAPHYVLLRPELLLRILPWLLAALSTASVAWLSARRLGPRLRLAFWRRSLGQRGTAELEFALAMPVFLVSVLTTVQIALMVNAELVVDYAAFCAARSAAVWVPQDTGSEPANSVGDEGSEKWTRIKHAATISVLPIAPRMSTFLFGFFGPGPSASAPIDSGALARLASAADVQRGAGIDYFRLGRDVVDKFLYADQYTTVELLDASGRVARAFPGDSPITARVTHKFEMNVPLAGHLLGAAFGSRYISFIGPFYIPISATYTLMAGAHV